MKTDESYFFQNFWMNVWRSLTAHIHSIVNITTRLRQNSHTSLFIPRSLSYENRRHSSRITEFSNILILWITLVPCTSIKSHKCWIGLISGDMAGHWNVSIASCCLNSLIMRDMCSLALSFINIGLSANGWLSKWGTTCALSTLSRYATPFGLPCKTFKFNLQLKEKHLQTITPPQPNAVVPITFPTWNAVFPCRLASSVPWSSFAQETDKG
jgi:hypothetical protein